AGEGPDQEHDARGVHLPQDVGRDDEDARADHRADHEGRGIEPRDRLDEFGARLLRGRHVAALLVVCGAVGNLVATAGGRYVLRRIFRQPRGSPCAYCRGMRNSSPCSSKWPTATRKPRNICASCSPRRRSAARRTSKRSSASSTRPTKSPTKW